MSDALPTVKIVNPDKPGDFMIINESDFDANVHKPFGAKKTEPANPPGGDSARNIPEGLTLEVKHSGGGRWKALVNGEPLKHSEGEDAGKPVVFASKDDAMSALEAYARHVSESEPE